MPGPLKKLNRTNAPVSSFCKERLMKEKNGKSRVLVIGSEPRFFEMTQKAIDGSYELH